MQPAWFRGGFLFIHSLAAAADITTEGQAGSETSPWSFTSWKMCSLPKRLVGLRNCDVTLTLSTDIYCEPLPFSFDNHHHLFFSLLLAKRGCVSHEKLCQTHESTLHRGQAPASVLWWGDADRNILAFSKTHGVKTESQQVTRITSSQFSFKTWKSSPKNKETGWLRVFMEVLPSGSNGYTGRSVHMKEHVLMRSFSETSNRCCCGVECVNSLTLSYMRLSSRGTTGKKVGLSVLMSSMRREMSPW